MMFPGVGSVRLVANENSGEKYSQECKTSLIFLQTACPEVRLGDFALLHLGHRTVVCRMYPADFPCDNILQFDNLVSVFVEHKNKTGKPYSIKALNPASTGTVSVTVIVQNMRPYEKWEESPQADVIRNHCHNCLQQLCLVRNSFVNMKETRLGKVYGINGIIVNNISFDDSLWDSIFVSRQTQIKIDSVISKERYDAVKSSVSPVIVGGLTKQKAVLQDLVWCCTRQEAHFRQLNLRCPRRILLCGPPGCGKTSLVTSLAQENRAALVAINGTELIGSRPGESEERCMQLFNRARQLSKEGPCILLIDEIDTVCPPPGKSGTGNIHMVSSALMSELDSLGKEDGLIVLASTSRQSALDPALRRPGRMDREILLNVPDREQRLEILQIHAAGLQLAKDVSLPSLAEMTNGYVGADLACLCLEAGRQAFHRFTADSAVQRRGILQIPQEERIVTWQDFLSAFKLIRPSMQKGTEGVIDLKKINWDDIGGLKEVKRKLQQAVEWPLRHPEAFARLGLRPSQGILLYGPPGCCKTTLVQAAAKASGSTFLALSGAQLFSPFVGDSERLLVNTFQKARAMAPCILFLDEIDAIVGKRSESGTCGVHERLLSTLLNEMDGIGIRLDEKLHSSLQAEGDCVISDNFGSSPHSKMDNSKVVVVAATNRPDLVDAAILRPGRIDNIIYVPQPDSETRENILKVFTRKMPLAEVDLNSIARQTDYYTGADLESVCREAGLYALSESLNATCVTQPHFQKALQIVKPSLSPELVARYKQLSALSSG